VVSRVVHILGAIALLGTAFYVGGVLHPALRELDGEEAKRVTAALRRPWALVVMASIFLLLVSGFYNFVRVIMLNRDGVVDLPGAYHPLIGVKILAALALFFLVSLLSGRSPLAQRMQSRASLWFSVVFFLGLLIVAIAGVLKMLDKSPAEDDHLSRGGRERPQAFAEAEPIASISLPVVVGHAIPEFLLRHASE
jgi:hypothetical protein